MGAKFTILSILNKNYNTQRVSTVQTTLFKQSKTFEVIFLNHITHCTIENIWLCL